MSLISPTSVAFFNSAVGADHSNLQNVKVKKETKLILGGTQEGKIGPTQYEKMLHTFNKISEKAEKGVFFNPNRLTHYLYGGTCSAMTLAFAKDFINSSIKNINERIITVMKDYTKSGEAFRAEQIALNTIEESSLTTAEDFKRAKIQSIANYYDLEFDYASEDLNFESIKNDPNHFKEVMDDLPEGVYILRILRPSNNFKKEQWGHTTFYLKDSVEGDYFYDPNYGLTEIATGETSDFFIKHLSLLNDVWYISNPRFYKLKI
ncbi:MAG: hypothetical protein S4CHLAM7_05270 [Chlamydiae bacterium]|nr:hypothetical protein [Chlamydiota bacterium]